jgi:transposase-like protein
MKAEKFCSVCNGQFERACMICGWKKSKKKKFFKGKKKSLTNTELIVRDAKREHTMMLDQYSRNCMIYGNYTTQLTIVDGEIEKHRVFTQEIWQAIRVEGKTIHSLAEKHDLTENQIKRLLATALLQQNHGSTNKLRPEPVTNKKSKEEVEAEIAEIRSKRDTPKPPRRGTFADMEYIDEPETCCNGVEGMD